MKMNISTEFLIVIAPPGSKKNFGVILGSVLGAVAVVIAAFFLLVVLRRRKMARKPPSNGTAATSGQNASLGHRFSLALLQEATNNFDENWVIGEGGFGKVYKGVLRDETKVAVKRYDPKSQQALYDFHNEIEFQSRLCYRHLVSLIGYLDERKEMILVYEYMEKGTLRSHLYGPELPSLSWKQRLEICIGSARGLRYLHSAFARAIIHRDVQSAKILLDENLMAKVGDFELSLTGPGPDQTHVSTIVCGTVGYLAPEYALRGELTEKSDVYSFGVVLLEVLCGRPAFDRTLPTGTHVSTTLCGQLTEKSDRTLPTGKGNLVERAMEWQKRGELKQIVDPRIAGTVRSDSLRKFGETVEKCLADYGVERPTMGDVLRNLEYVLHLQEADLGISEVNGINSINRIAELSSRFQNIENLEGATVGEVSTSMSDSF